MLIIPIQLDHEHYELPQEATFGTIEGIEVLVVEEEFGWGILQSALPNETTEQTFIRVANTRH